MNFICYIKQLWHGDEWAFHNFNEKHDILVKAITTNRMALEQYYLPFRHRLYYGIKHSWLLHKCMIYENRTNRLVRHN
jgi:hypothetical protein